MKKPLVKLGVTAAAVAALVLGVSVPAWAGTNPSQSCYNSSGSNVGTQYGYLYTSSVNTTEMWGQCGTVYVQGRYYAYVGGPSYLSGYVSSPTQAIVNHTNMYWGWHYSSYNTNIQQSWFWGAGSKDA